ncbi:MAG: hypothetical protein K1000chlam4_00125 [Chlamydiae bacterium]|nr:hypothetical protein [Chlamydiota bacterium]
MGDGIVRVHTSEGTHSAPPREPPPHGVRIGDLPPARLLTSGWPYFDIVRNAIVALLFTTAGIVGLMKGQWMDQSTSWYLIGLGGVALLLSVMSAHQLTQHRRQLV